MFILAPLGAVFGLFAVFVATRPSAFRIERSLTIDATPGALFRLVNDFHEWVAWSPWEKTDPAMTRTYEGAPAGKGAIYRWSGNSKAGQGVMTIRETTADARIEIELQFIKPFAATNTAIFTFEPTGSGTRV